MEQEPNEKYKKTYIPKYCPKYNTIWRRNVEIDSSIIRNLENRVLKWRKDSSKLYFIGRLGKNEEKEDPLKWKTYIRIAKEEKYLKEGDWGERSL